MIRPIENHITQQGVDLRLSQSIAAFEHGESGLAIRLESGQEIRADFAVLCIGVRPESQLARDAGLRIGEQGGIVVNHSMQTSDPCIYAVGDVAEVSFFQTGERVQIPLAGPANRQGRIAADHLFGRSSTYRGTQGSAIVGAFGMTAAMTGMSEKKLRQLGRASESIYVHPSDHAAYYPGANQMTIKLSFDPASGVILGAQGVGETGVDKRIDVIAMAIQAGMTVFDLEESELCYAPQFGHAKDPVNMAGFVAAGVIRGDHRMMHFRDIERDDPPFLLDVRTTQEYVKGHLPGATNIPVEELRNRMDELPTDRKIATYCQVGQRGYLASRMLGQKGFDAVNLSGGYRLWLQGQPVASNQSIVV